MHGCMQTIAIKQHPFCERPCMTLHFRGASAHIGLFELPRTSGSGHSGQTGASLDVGATLAGSSDENIGLMSGICAFSLIVLALVAIGKSAPKNPFEQRFAIFFLSHAERVSSSLVVIELSVHKWLSVGGSQLL